MDSISPHMPPYDLDPRSHQQHLLQADKIAMLEILASGVAHEINNPNNLITLNTDVIGDVWREILPILDAHAQAHPHWRLGGLAYQEMRANMTDLLAGITEGAQRISGIVNDLRNFVKRDPGDLDQLVNLNEVINSSLSFTRNLISKSTRYFALRLDENVPRIRGNAQQLQQLVINLLTNSCQALVHDQQRIEISTGCQDHSHVTLHVIDTGPGISADLIGRVFEPFFTTRRELGNTGLGLTVSYGIVRNHGGTLALQSREGVGTTITITFPAASKDPSEQTQDLV